MHTYKIYLHREPEGGFTVSVPALPSCITYGDDVDEAIAMAQEAIELYIEELRERGEVVPDDSNTLEYSFKSANRMNLKPNHLIKRLEQHGFVFKRSKGSHRLYITIPSPTRRLSYPYMAEGT